MTYVLLLTYLAEFLHFEINQFNKNTNLMFRPILKHFWYKYYLVKLNSPCVIFHNTSSNKMYYKSQLNMNMEAMLQHDFWGKRNVPIDDRSSCWQVKGIKCLDVEAGTYSSLVSPPSRSGTGH